MPQIFYYHNGAGTYVARWPGRSVRGADGPRKEGQVYLGRVVSKAENVFFKRGMGYYRFDPGTQECTPVPQDEVPPYDGPVDGRERRRPVCCAFGDAYLLDRLIAGSGYSGVLDEVPFGNRDTLMSMVQYYTLGEGADMHAEHWYKCSYASFLYPRANVASQRVSDLLRALGSDDARRSFLEAHIRFLTESTDDACYVLVDSTGCPNACDVPITKVSNHDGVVTIGFRLIAVVQRSTGLPIWYEVIPGNVVDVSTVENVVRKLRLYGCEVVYVSGDAGYYCPSNMERLALSGIDFLARMNPTYDTYKRVLEEHFDELDDPRRVERFRDRFVSVVKVECAVATDAETGEEVRGWVYLCRDVQSHHSKCDHLIGNKKRTKKMTSGEVMAALERLGVFAIASTRDLAPGDVLPEYYLRQAAEQLFDFAKGCAKMLPVRNRTLETIKGHMLLSFVATFLHVMVKNRMGVLDTRYVAVPRVLSGSLSEADGEAVEVGLPDGTTQTLVEQDPVAEALGTGTSSVFRYAGMIAAEVFETEIVPCVPTREVRDVYEAFGLCWPVTVVREGQTLTPMLKEGQRDRCTCARAFATRPAVTDEQVEAKRSGGGKKAKGDGKADPEGQQAGAAGTKAAEPARKRRPGRPKGSKNKKTLEREAEIARQKAEGTYVEPPKRRRGRPKGSKNKRTLEREAAERAAAEGDDGGGTKA